MVYAGVCMGDDFGICICKDADQSGNNIVTEIVPEEFG